MPDQFPAWLTSWLDSVTFGQVIAWVAGAVTLVVAIRRGGPMIRRTVELLTASIKLVDTLATLPKDLDEIRHELKPNGGSSLKDSSIRSELALAELSKEVAHVRRQSASLKTSIAKTNRRLEEHISRPGE